MKTIARVGAGLSFTCFFVAGAAVLANVNPRRPGEEVVLIAIGLFLVGIAFFVGPMLWVAAEKWCSKQNDK
jgi:hypothetical protein